jgi:tRNA threonylcarbamoyladenosine biosynthesis protein TsaB
MSLILNIDTSSTQASVSISRDGALLAKIQNEDQKEHASFLQAAVKKLMAAQQLLLHDLGAVAVVNGPGSYTGLRVGLASAKGICYVLGKPLITLGTLPLMAKAAISHLKTNSTCLPLICPMIDARRMEVFTGVYNASLEAVEPAQAKILTSESFVDILRHNKMLFFGNGADKFKGITNHANALFAGSFDTSEALSVLAYSSFERGLFTDLAYSEPLYLKEFYTGL